MTRGINHRLLLLSLIAWCSPAPAYAFLKAADAGWVVDNSGHRLLDDAAIRRMKEAGVQAVRFGFRLGNSHQWDAKTLAWYDPVVDALLAQGIQPITLVGGESTSGFRQRDWIANNHEHTGGDGDNAFIRNYTRQFAILAAHFRSRVKLWEVWNEPNAWTSQPSPGDFTGGSFIYPSNFAAMLDDVYEEVHGRLGLRDLVLFSGGIFGHSIHNVYSTSTAGADYLDATYRMGVRVLKTWKHTKRRLGSYPLDGIGQHIYIDQGGLTTAARVRQYYAWMHGVLLKWEGKRCRKPTYVTEAGWTTRSVSRDVQAQDLDILFRVSRSLPYVATVVWFSFHDSTGANLYYGLIGPNGGLKPAFFHYQRW